MTPFITPILPALRTSSQSLLAVTFAALLASPVWAGELDPSGGSLQAVDASSRTHQRAYFLAAPAARAARPVVCSPSRMTRDDNQATQSMRQLACPEVALALVAQNLPLRTKFRVVQR